MAPDSEKRLGVDIVGLLAGNLPLQVLHTEGISYHIMVHDRDGDGDGDDDGDKVAAVAVVIVVVVRRSVFCFFYPRATASSSQGVARGPRPRNKANSQSLNCTASKNAPFRSSDTSICAI